jgi:cell division protein FtsQ
MDGGRRLLRPLKEVFAALEPSFPAYAGISSDAALDSGRPFTRAAQRRRRSVLAMLIALAAGRWANGIFSLLVFAVVGIYGCLLGGQYASFVAEHGTLPDLVARSVGFSLKTITIAGAHELTQQEILDAAGVGPLNSLCFINVAKLRDRLKALPLVREASVSKLFPNRLLIEIQERKPAALWQKDGQVEVIAADGMPIDKLHDPRYFALPRAVGEGANEHIGDYLALLDAAGDMRGRIEAGLFVAKRRWTLKMKNGIEVALPANGALAAVRKLAGLDHDFHVLDKDIVGLDLRVPGRLIVTLSDDVARARMEQLAHPSKRKGGQS